jgi:uncharacterized membrane protein YkvA (DUF1232 family)
MTIANVAQPSSARIDESGSANGSAAAEGARSQSEPSSVTTAAKRGPGHPPVREWLERSVMKATEALGQRYLQRLTGARADITRSLQAIPERMHRAGHQAQLVLELLDDVRSGAYRDVRWYSVTVAAAALLYAVSPADIIPDVLPLVGSFDDVALIALAVRVLRRDLLAYCRFKGYPEEQYFGAPS